MKKVVYNGIDNIVDLDKVLKNRKIGLITGGAAITKDIRLAVDFLTQRYHVTKLFNTIYGIRSEYIYGEHTEKYIDFPTGLEVLSIFNRNINAPTPEMLKDLDVLVFDIREVGARYYEYLYCLGNIMKECAKSKMPLVVLDRINPINGMDIEGTVCSTDMHTMVGDYGLPNRTALTLGEFANYINGEYSIGCSLEVIKCVNWERESYLDETDLPWVLPSPSLPHINASILYTGMCLFEGISSINEGRGTSKPFEIVGAPWLNADELTVRMNKKGLYGVKFGRIHYIPTSSKHMKEICNGIQIHIMERNGFAPVRTALTLIEEIRNIHPKQLEWASISAGHDVKSPESKQVFETYFDKLLGNSEFRKNELTADSLLSLYKNDLCNYGEIKKKYHLY